MPISYIGGSSGQNDWGHTTSITPSATDPAELWVVCGWSTWGSPGITLDGTALNNSTGIGTGWCGTRIGWRIVGVGSHTAAVSGSDSVAVAVMRFRGWKGNAYLDVGSECIAYGTDAPFPNQDLTAIAGGVAAAVMCCSENSRGLYVQSGGTIVGQYTTRVPCDGKSVRFGWAYRLPLTTSATESCYFTQNSYTTEGQCAIHMSFAPFAGGARAQVI